MTDAQIREFAEHVLIHVRPAMRRTIGDRTAAQYNKADELASSIAVGIKKAFEEMNMYEPGE
jgi:hypothetical protein